jgi:hypothetical protein
VNGKLTFWILGALYTLLLLVGGGYVAAQNDRIVKLEEFKSAVTLDMNTIKWDVKGIRQDVCRTEGKVDDLMEWTTKRRQYRTPCP